MQRPAARNGPVRLKQCPSPRDRHPLQSSVSPIFTPCPLEPDNDRARINIPSDKGSTRNRIHGQTNARTHAHTHLCLLQVVVFTMVPQSHTHCPSSAICWNSRPYQARHGPSGISASVRKQRRCSTFTVVTTNRGDQNPENRRLGHTRSWHSYEDRHGSR